MGKRGEMVPTIDRLLPRVVKDPDAGCWTWTGATRANGYGYISEGSRAEGTHHTPLVHRVAYEALVGPIPKGLQLDHLCRNRACVNPDHLEPVTARENVARSMAPSAIVLRTNLCKRGHDFSGDNVYVSPAGKRRCRACWKANQEAMQGDRINISLPVPVSNRLRQVVAELDLTPSAFVCMAVEAVLERAEALGDA